jgi:hypothetical protein
VTNRLNRRIVALDAEETSWCKSRYAVAGISWHQRRLVADEGGTRSAKSKSG